MVDGKEIKLEGNIALVGFEILEPAELAIIQKMMRAYIKKLSEMGDYKEMKLTLQQHAKGKSFKHEIIGLAFLNNGRLTASMTEWNVYNAVSQVCEKIIAKAAHKLKKEQRHDKVIFR